MFLVKRFRQVLVPYNLQRCRMLWTRTEYDKLQQILKKEGDNVDFEKIAEKYFPNKDPLELAYDAEFPPNEFEPEPAFNRSIKRPSGRYHLQYTKAIDDAIIREFKNELTLRGKTLKEKEEWARSIDPLLNWSRARNRYQIIKKIIGNGTRFTDLELRRISGLEQEGCSDTEISVALGYSSAQQFKEKMVFHMSNNPLTVENSRRAALLVQRQSAIIGPEHVDLGLLARVTLPLVKKYIDETPADLAQVKRTAVPMDADIGTKYWSYRLNAKLLDMIHAYKDKEINWKEVSVSMGFPVRKCKDVYKKLSDDESWLLKRRGFFSDEDDIELLKAWKVHKENYNSYKTLMKHESDSYRLSTRLQRIFRNGLVKKKPKYIQAIAQSGMSKDEIVSFLGSLNAPSWKQLYRDVLDSDN